MELGCGLIWFRLPLDIDATAGLEREITACPPKPKGWLLARKQATCVRSTAHVTAELFDSLPRGGGGRQSRRARVGKMEQCAWQDEVVSVTVSNYEVDGGISSKGEQPQD